jgi:hypothetical protein
MLVKPMTWLFELSLLIAPSRLLCQVAAGDSATGAAPDSQVAPGSTAKTSGDSVKTSGDSVQVLDSLAQSPATADTGRAPAGTAGSTSNSLQKDTTRARSDTLSSPSPPRDSILQRACGAPGASSVARDLLVIVFRPDAGARERAAAVRSVNGKLLGPVSAEPGAYYVLVPVGGQEFKLRAAADELAQLAPVQQVGSRACPVPQSKG